MSIISILAFILALGLIILIHEGGHFFFARRVNVLCREYAFGMGPQILKTKKGETTYSLRLLPIGGFCAIAGEEEEQDPLKKLEEVALDIQDGVVKRIFVDDRNPEANKYPRFKNIAHDLYDEKETGNLFITVSDLNGENERTLSVDPKCMYVLTKEEFQIAPYNRCLSSKRKRDRAMIMFGGPMMNFVLAIVVFFIGGLIGGFVDTKSNVCKEVSLESAAEAAGMKNGDILNYICFDGKDYIIASWEDVEARMNEYATTSTLTNSEITLKYTRNGEELSGTCTPELTAYSLGGLGFCVSDDGRVQFGFKYLNDDASHDYRASYYDMFGEDAMPLGSIVVKANEKDINCLQDLYLYLLNDTDGTEIVFTLENGDTYSFTPYTEKLMKTQKSLSGDQIPLAKIYIGVSPEYKISLIKSFGYAFKRTGQSTTMILDTLALLFTGKVGVKNLGGIVSIFSYTSDAAKQGFASLLNWIGLLSVNIGIMNLLPIPALDGGRLVFVAYEAITKKKPSPKVETILITVTMIILLAFMAFVTFNDIMRLF